MRLSYPCVDIHVEVDVLLVLILILVCQHFIALLTDVICFVLASCHKGVV